MFSNTLKEYLEYLEKMFTLFEEFNLVIKSSKTFLDYLLVGLLE